MDVFGTAAIAASHIATAVLLLSLWHFSVQGGVNALLGFVEPEQARVFVKQMISMFVGNASVRDLTATHVLLCALILVLLGVISTADSALERFKISLCEKTLLSVDLVQKAPNASYDEAISRAGAAAKMKRTQVT